MRSQDLGSLLFIVWFVSLAVWGQSAKPSAPRNGGDFSNNTSDRDEGAGGYSGEGSLVESAIDSVTPLPEDANVSSSASNKVFSDDYFGITYTLPPDWEEKYKGPPPSDSGRYVLAQIRPAETFKGPIRGNILITAQDMFFTPPPVSNALDLNNSSKDNLKADYKVAMMPPMPTKIAGRPFTFFAYWSPVAELHWYVAATEIRCHVIEIVLTSRDTKLLASLVLDMDKMN